MPFLTVVVYGSILINSGKDIVLVSKRPGRSKTGTTTDIYAHIIKESDAQSSDIISDMIFNQRLYNKNSVYAKHRRFTF